MSKVPYVHTGGPEPCKGVAFYLDAGVLLREVIKAANITYPDGSNPTPGDQVRCGCCGRDQMPWTAFSRMAAKL
jgi:hypothetical protein